MTGLWDNDADPMDGKSVGEPTQLVSKVKLSTKVENTGHWLVEDHAQIWEVLKTEEETFTWLVYYSKQSPKAKVQLPGVNCGMTY
ncbi:ral guanine nucleotide dissociation stimulator-like 1 [Cricetulus griseus]|nr:ral guanine nucleotide dissociation stimulator-like 1 [Cricetulus griseus]